MTRGLRKVALLLCLTGGGVACFRSPSPVLTDDARTRAEAAVSEELKTAVTLRFLFEHGEGGLDTIRPAASAGIAMVELGFRDRSFGSTDKEARSAFAKRAAGAVVRALPSLSDDAQVSVSMEMQAPPPPGTSTSSLISYAESHTWRVQELRGGR
jgi:hypothetical protein